MKLCFHSGKAFSSSQSICKLPTSREDFLLKLLDRRWTLPRPDTRIHHIKLSETGVCLEAGQSGSISFRNNTDPLLGDRLNDEKNQGPSFYVVRDDLLHPLANGNKPRKLDALLPLLEDHLVTDVVTCGGCQSAHTAAVAVLCAERGLRSHLLLRGEQPDIPTEYNLISKMYGNVTYVPRSVYAQREEMLRMHAAKVAGDKGSVVWFSDIFENPLNLNASGLREEHNACSDDENHPRKVVIVNEGAGDAIALLGVIRLVSYLSQSHVFGKERAVKFIVDAGTGTTAVGLGLGAYCLGLPWEVHAVMLADTLDGYHNQEKRLISDFKNLCTYYCLDHGLDGIDVGFVNWVKRFRPRRFGKVLEGEAEECQNIARKTGILLDPIYTLAAWQLSATLSLEEAGTDVAVVMLHTGGTLGLFGLAQRYKTHFEKLRETSY